MSQLPKRSLHFRLLFSDTPLQPDLSCLSPHAAPAETLELYLDDVLLDCFHRVDGDADVEFPADSRSHTLFLRTNGLIRLESDVFLPRGTDTCYLEAREEQMFRLTLTDMTEAPEEIDVLETGFSADIIEHIADELASFTTNASDLIYADITLHETDFTIDYEIEWDLEDKPDLSYAMDYRSVMPSHDADDTFSALSVRNRRDLLRLAHACLRSHHRLQHLHFVWHDTFLRATPDDSLWKCMEQLCFEIYIGEYAELFRDFNIRCLRIFPTESGFLIRSYDDLLPNSRPLIERDIIHPLSVCCSDLSRLHSSLVESLQQTKEIYVSEMLAEDCGEYIQVTNKLDPYFFFD